MTKGILKVAYEVLRSNSAVAISRSKKKYGSNTSISMYASIEDIAAAQYVLGNEYRKLYEQATALERLRADSKVDRLKMYDEAKQD